MQRNRFVDSLGFTTERTEKVAVCRDLFLLDITGINDIIEIDAPDAENASGVLR